MIITTPLMLYSELKLRRCNYIIGSCSQRITVNLVSLHRHKIKFADFIPYFVWEEILK